MSTWDTGLETLACPPGLETPSEAEHSLQRPPFLSCSLQRGLARAAHAGFAEQSRARSQHLIQFVLPRLKYEMVASQTFKGRERLLKFKF